MRTTVDLPDDLYRQVKARAALEGLRLKQYIERALRDSLYRRELSSEVAEPKVEYGEDALVLGDDCAFPLVRGEAGKEMASLKGGRAQEILDDEDVLRDRRSR